MEELSAAQGTKPESEHHQGPALWKTHIQALLCHMAELGPTLSSGVPLPDFSFAFLFSS